MDKVPGRCVVRAINGDASARWFAIDTPTEDTRQIQLEPGQSVEFTVALGTVSLYNGYWVSLSPDVTDDVSLELLYSLAGGAFVATFVPVSSGVNGVLFLLFAAGFLIGWMMLSPT